MQRLVRSGLPRQPTYNLLITRLFYSLDGADLVAVLRLFLTRTGAQLAAETKCARYFGASDGENLSAGISWFTFFALE